MACGFRIRVRWTRVSVAQTVFPWKGEQYAQANFYSREHDSLVSDGLGLKWTSKKHIYRVIVLLPEKIGFRPRSTLRENEICHQTVYSQQLSHFNVVPMDGSVFFQLIRADILAGVSHCGCRTPTAHKYLVQHSHPNPAHSTK